MESVDPLFSSPFNLVPENAKQVCFSVDCKRTERPDVPTVQSKKLIANVTSEAELLPLSGVKK